MKLPAAFAVLLLSALASATASSPAASLAAATPILEGPQAPFAPLVPNPIVTDVALPGPIVAFGDSYTEGFGASAGESYPSVLAASLGLAVANKGISGQTAEEALPRLHRDVVSLRPRLAIVEFGANEAFRGYPLSACIDALDRMLGDLRAHGIPVLLVGVRTAAFQGGFDDELRRLAAKHGTGLVLDVLAGTLDDPRTVAPDGAHPNGAGYRIMESRIRPEAQRILAA